VPDLVHLHEAFGAGGHAAMYALCLGQVSTCTTSQVTAVCCTLQLVVCVCVKWLRSSAPLLGLCSTWHVCL